MGTQCVVSIPDKAITLYQNDFNDQQYRKSYWNVLYVVNILNKLHKPYYLLWLPFCFLPIMTVLDWRIWNHSVLMSWTHYCRLSCVWSFIYPRNGFVTSGWILNRVWHLRVCHKSKFIAMICTIATVLHILFHYYI